MAAFHPFLPLLVVRCGVATCNSDVRSPGHGNQHLSKPLQPTACHRYFYMLFQDHNEDAAEVERVSVELARSLKRCQKLLFDYRSELAANSNMPELLDEGDEKLLG